MGDCTMTRKTRTRQSRLHSALQSGYCAVCHLPYNNLEDHIQSKKHQKLIGEDANYISIDGFIDQDANIEPFLHINGIDAIDINGKTIGKDFGSKMTRNSYPRFKSSNCDGIKQSPLSPTGSETGHRLRSRKQINYAMSPSLDEDSLTDNSPKIESPKGLRSSSRLHMRAADAANGETDEVWNSGRPKRSCIRQKRSSADERLVSDNKTYYRVEVMPSKLRSSGHFKDPDARKTEATQDKNEKTLIVKFKKLREAELTRLNNEAENFLFPKREEFSEEEGEVDGVAKNPSVAEEGSRSPRVKVEDDCSMDSTCSSTKQRKRRRTHAEAFIMDNQKYYKFETPGSRLRYQGSLFPELTLKAQKSNGDVTHKVEKVEEKEVRSRGAVKLDEYEFSFEKKPVDEPKYTAFKRQDRGEERYVFFSDNAYWDPFILPYQTGPIPPLDPKICISQYVQLKKLLEETPSSSASCSTTDSASNCTPTSEMETQDEDSKLSEAPDPPTIEPTEARRSKRRLVLSPSSTGRNPRKSPRQHASTLAILSLLQRKRKSRSGEKLPPELPVIPEEKVERVTRKSSPEGKRSSALSPERSPQGTPSSRRLKPGRKPRIDYRAIGRSFEEEFANLADYDDQDIEVEPNDFDFRNKMDIIDILRNYDSKRIKETKEIRAKTVNGVPGKKIPRRKKKNKTGWPPNRRRVHTKKKDDDETTNESASVNADESEEETDSIKSKPAELMRNNVRRKRVVVNNCDQNRVVKKRKRRKRVVRQIPAKVIKKVNNCKMLQPYVRVQKINSDMDSKVESGGESPRRTNGRSRRMPASPRSPRALRKPRGRWYRER